MLKENKMPVTKKTPADFNPQAKPYDTKPSAAIITATADAIEKLGQSGEIQEYDRGSYWVDRTVSPNGGATGQQQRQCYFNDTEIRAAGNISNYTTVRSEGT